MAHETYHYLWRCGQIVESAGATIHVRSVGHASVSAVFEGLNAYWNADREQLYVFRLREHLDRLLESTNLASLSTSYPVDTLQGAVIELLRRNDVRRDVHIRPWSFASGNPTEQMVPAGAACETVIDSWPFQSSLGTERTATAAFTPWTRIPPDSMPPRIKAFANYHNGRLGNIAARSAGADWPIFLNAHGEVSESSGACVGIFADGRFHTPPLESGILHSITRATVIDLLRDELAIPVVEQPMVRADVQSASEVVFIGTSAEVLPIVRVDDRPVGTGGIGPLTARLRQIYASLVRGRHPKRGSWLTPVWPDSSSAGSGING